MKYSTKEILEMPLEDIYSKCSGQCETKNCLFKKSLWQFREDGFCIKETLKNIDKWLKKDEETIEDLEDKIKIVKDRIKKYKKLQLIINKELEK